MKYSIVSAIIPGVSSVVRPNTPLHDQEQGEVTAGTATSHTASQGRSRRFGRHGDIGHSLQLRDGCTGVSTHSIVSLLTEQGWG